MSYQAFPMTLRRQRGWLGWSLVWTILSVIGLSVLSTYQWQALALRQAGQQWVGLETFEAAEAALALILARVEQQGLLVAACGDPGPSISSGQRWHWTCQTEVDGTNCLCAVDEAAAPGGSAATRGVTGPRVQVQAVMESNTRLRLQVWSCSRSEGVCDPITPRALSMGQARTRLSVWLTRPQSNDLASIPSSAEDPAVSNARWTLEPGSWSEL